jgi:hypothetical protein
MALFSGKIVEARYMDTEYSIIEILYEGADGNVYSHALRPDPENQDWKDLITEGWDQDKLIEETVKYKKSASSAFATQVNEAAKALVDKMLAQKSETQSDLDVLSLAQARNATEQEYEKRKESDLQGQSVYNFIVDKNSDKDELFKFKMWALDLDFVKDKDKETKAKLRKVQSILDGLTMISELK